MAEAARIKRFTAPVGSHPVLTHGTQYIERQVGGMIEQWALVRMDPRRHLLTYERIGLRVPQYG